MRRTSALRRRYGRARGGMPGISHWSTFAGGGYELVYGGRKYSIDPRFDGRRSGGWSLRVTPGTAGLHGSINRQGKESDPFEGAYPFTRASSAVVAARAHAKRLGPEPHGIMAGQAAKDAEIVAIMRAPDFWNRVAALRDESAAAGDTNMARICRVALSERSVRPEGHDARECARALYHGGGG